MAGEDEEDGEEGRRAVALTFIPSPSELGLYTLFDFPLCRLASTRTIHLLYPLPVSFSLSDTFTPFPLALFSLTLLPFLLSFHFRPLTPFPLHAPSRTSHLPSPPFSSSLDLSVASALRSVLLSVLLCSSSNVDLHGRV